MQAILSIGLALTRAHRVMLREWSGVNFAIAPLQVCTNLYQSESDSTECWTVQPQHKNGVVAVACFKCQACTGCVPVDILQT